MIRKILSLALAGCLTAGLVTPTHAASTWRRLGTNPFYKPPLTSVEDLKTLVRTKSAELKTGFTKAGYPDLYPAFTEQFPAAKIETVKVAPGETFVWLVFKNKATGKVVALKDVTYKGAAPFDAYRFFVDQNGKRHEFVIPFACGNVALRSVAAVPPPPAPVTVAPPPPPPAPAPVAPPPPPPKPEPAPVVAAPVAPPPPPEPAPKPAPVVVAPVAVAPPPPPPPAPVAPPPPPPVVKKGGPLADVGYAHQPDAANYLFGRLGYEYPLSDKLYLTGLLGGFARFNGDDGGSAFTADVLLDYHWYNRLSFGLGAGLWVGEDDDDDDDDVDNGDDADNNGTQVDLIAELGYRLSGNPAGRSQTLFLEMRSAFDELDDTFDYGRFGVGLRFRF